MSLWRHSAATAAMVAFAGRGFCWRLPGHHAQSEGDLHRLVAALAALPKGHAVRFVAGHDLAVHWLQSPPASLRSLHELRLVAAARCVHLHGGTADDWWITAEWDARWPFVCTALPRSQVEPLLDLVKARQLQAHWETPLGLVHREFRAESHSDGWHGLRTAQRARVWHCRRGRISHLVALALDPALPKADLDRQVTQLVELEALQDPQLERGAVRWRQLTGAHEGESALAAAGIVRGRGRSATGIATSIALAGAVVACGIVAWQSIQTQQALTDARQSLAALQARGAPPAVRKQPAQQLTSQERLAWNQVARQLNTPWPALLDTLEGLASPEVALVAIEPDSRRGTVRVQAEARRLVTLLEYADALSGASGVDGVRLLRHESNDQDPARPLRLSLEARFGPVREAP